MSEACARIYGKFPMFPDATLLDQRLSLCYPTP